MEGYKKKKKLNSTKTDPIKPNVIKSKPIKSNLDCKLARKKALSLRDESQPVKDEAQTLKNETRSSLDLLSNIINRLRLDNVQRNDLEGRKVLRDANSQSDKILRTNVPYNCVVCAETLTSDLSLYKHLIGAKHRDKIVLLSFNNENFINCRVCADDIFGDENMIGHLNSRKHKESLSKLVKQKNIEFGGFFRPKSDSLVDEFCLDSVLMSRKFNILKKTKPEKHLYSKTYIEMFLEEGPLYIFNKSEKKLNYIEFGISLLFLTSDKIRWCFVCNEKIPDDHHLIYEHLLCLTHIKKLNQLIDDELKSIDNPGQFKILALAKECLKIIDENRVSCILCSREILNDDNTIRNHIEIDVMHRNMIEKQKESNCVKLREYREQFKDIWYIVQRYCCQLCYIRVKDEIDFVNHLSSKKHTRQLTKLKSKEVTPVYEFCFSCVSMTLGLPDTFTNHCKDYIHRYLVEKREYSVLEMTRDAKNLLSNLEDTAETLIQESDKVMSQEELIDVLLRDLEKCVSDYYPEAKAYAFGSRITNIALEDSDLDIILDCGNVYNGMQLLSKCHEYILTTQKCLENQPRVWELLDVIVKARVSIIKIVHRNSKVHCDISFSNGLKVEETRIVRLLIQSCPLARKMIIFTKKWSKLCLLTVYQGFSTFTITWLVIFYLQIIRILPPIATLIRDKKQSRIIAGWETGINEEIPVKKSLSTFKELMSGFFRFYANYDYRFHVISPLMGSSLEKRNFTEIYILNLPCEMKSYIRYVCRTKKSEIFCINSPICLQDPIELSQNIASSISKLMLRSFIQYCKISSEILNT